MHEDLKLNSGKYEQGDFNPRTVGLHLPCVDISAGISDRFCGSVSVLITIVTCFDAKHDQIDYNDAKISDALFS